MKYILFVLLVHSPGVPPTGMMYQTQHDTLQECMVNGRQIASGYRKEYGIELDIRTICVETFVL